VYACTKANRSKQPGHTQQTVWTVRNQMSALIAVAADPLSFPLSDPLASVQIAMGNAWDSRSCGGFYSYPSSAEVRGAWNRWLQRPDMDNLAVFHAASDHAAATAKALEDGKAPPPPPKDPPAPPPAAANGSSDAKDDKEADPSSAEAEARGRAATVISPFGDGGSITAGAGVDPSKAAAVQSFLERQRDEESILQCMEHLYRAALTDKNRHWVRATSALPAALHEHASHPPDLLWPPRCLFCGVRAEVACSAQCAHPAAGQALSLPVGYHTR
jgi:hypothetical protein